MTFYQYQGDKDKEVMIVRGGYLTVEDATQVLGVSLRTIRRYLRDNKLVPIYRVPGTEKIYFNAKDVFELRKARKVR